MPIAKDHLLAEVDPDDEEEEGAKDSSAQAGRQRGKLRKMAKATRIHDRLFGRIHG